MPLQWTRPVPLNPRTRSAWWLRPLGVLTGQGMQALSPFAGILLDQNAWKEVANYLDKRGAILWMLQRMDELESQREAKLRESKNHQPPPSQPLV